MVAEVCNEEVPGGIKRQTGGTIELAVSTSGSPKASQKIAVAVEFLNAVVYEFGYKEVSGGIKCHGIRDCFKTPFMPRVA